MKHTNPVTKSDLDLVMRCNAFVLTNVPELNQIHRKLFDCLIRNIELSFSDQVWAIVTMYRVFR